MGPPHIAQSGVTINLSRINNEKMTSKQGIVFILVNSVICGRLESGVLRRELSRSEEK